MANIPIGNNIIYTQRKGSTELKDEVETVLFGAERIDVGVPTDRKEIAKDPVSGYNYERNAIDSKTIYNLQTQKRKCFFVLDLETGRGGNQSWYPGAIQVADIAGSDIPIRADKSDSAEIIITVSNVVVKVLDLEYNTIGEIWYKINYNENIGYVKNTYISNVRYSDPY